MTNFMKNSLALLFNYPTLLCNALYCILSTCIKALYNSRGEYYVCDTGSKHQEEKTVIHCKKIFDFYFILQWTWMTTIILDPRQLRACPGPDPSHGRSTPDRRRDFSTLGPRQVLPSLGPNRACSSPGHRPASCYHREDQADQVNTSLFYTFMIKNIFFLTFSFQTGSEEHITLRRQFNKPFVSRVHSLKQRSLEINQPCVSRLPHFANTISEFLCTDNDEKLLSMIFKPFPSAKKEDDIVDIVWRSERTCPHDG